ncbi:hypothetical protein CAPTEDRAFT_175107 [Capitella teleta]|uniref:Uncharacterized protein n=1 Tax=Capitella teleta TaxID=283909 RepID=R7U5R6_CAPTE|nr:hypothetical protein CAPTEDRAFT_175107 [Capitella teleta]|eukprot:ELU01715.1 hypothetical protein CAPTEDRAFT_175107 [Capitella teleta]
MHTIKYRRDVVFCQALTAAIAGFATKFTSNFTDRSFLNQLMKIGILLNFESLLSCHSDELGMLEDYSVGARDLEQVTFIVRAKDNEENSPEVHSGKRGGYVVHIFLPLLIFQSLPLELQRGRQIRVTSVIFSVGINEQATLAERFGDTTVQEMVNAENYRKLHAYHEKYQDIVAPSDEAPSAKGLPLEQMLRHLHINVMSKKTKNVEILHFAAEICRKMNGIRFVSCKSAKDRTSMAVTLECIQILQREQDLASHAFLHALECLRSEGVRRENTVKNTGVRKYAFNSLQLLSIPKLYRPPNGTFGNVQT